ncbi:MAG: hypothetical protein ACE5M4_02380 [Anaerolineales bacterium]
MDKMSAVSTFKRRRPIGVYVIIFFLGLRMLDFSFETVRIQRGGLSSLLLPGTVDPAINTLVSVTATLFLLLLIIGLLLLRRWALVVTVMLTGVSLAYGLWLHALGTPQYLDMLAAVLVGFYLNLRELQQAFEPEAPIE